MTATSKLNGKEEWILEKFGLTENTLPEVTTENKTITGENQSETDKGITIPVKFNKQIKNLTPEEATVLAQKGLKFDSIAEDYARLKELASQSGKSVPEFLQHLKEEKTPLSQRKKLNYKDVRTDSDPHRVISGKLIKEVVIFFEDGTYQKISSDLKK